jgi:stage II sporulation protein D
MQVLAFILCLLSAAFPCGKCLADQACTVRVGLFSGRSFSACTVSSQSRFGAGELLVEDGGTVFRIPADELVTVRAKGSEVKVSSSAIGFEPDDDWWMIESRGLVTVSPEGLPARTYRGRVLIAARDGVLALVNDVELGDYLRGVLPAEIPASFHEEALKAQAIAARTYTVANMRKHKAQGYDLCDQPHCQAYLGVEGEDPRLDAAVTATAGLIVTYEGKPIHAVYHDTCGGRTAGNETAWQGSAPLPYLRPVSDCEGDVPRCAQSPNATWTRQVSQAKLGTALARFGVKGAVTGIEAAKCDANRRPEEYRVRSDGGETVILAGVLRSTVNSALGWNTLPSADFQAAANGDTIVFAGRGNGHGVGLCQWGANAMAQEGKTAEEILKHYYTGVTVQVMR